VDEVRDFEWSDRREGTYRNVGLVSSGGARCRLQLTGQWLDSLLPAHVGHYVVVLGATLRDDGTGCAMLSTDRVAVNSGVKLAIHRSLFKPKSINRAHCCKTFSLHVFTSIKRLI